MQTIDRFPAAIQDATIPHTMATMSLLIRATPESNGASPRRYLPLAGVAALFALALLLAPGDIAAKSRFLLHGVCAQRPSHSLLLGGSILPLDARMTGIYIGALTTSLWVVARGRERAGRALGPRVLAILALFLGVMAADGVNALLGDLGLAQAYVPVNAIRLATGVLAGVALGIGGSHILATAFGAREDRQRAVVTHAGELVWPVLLSAAVAAPALSGLGIFFAPYAVGLVLAVTVVFWQFTAALLALVLPSSTGVFSSRRLLPIATASLSLVLLTMIAIAAARTWAEMAHLLPRLT